MAAHASVIKKTLNVNVLKATQEPSAKLVSATPSGTIFHRKVTCLLLFLPHWLFLHSEGPEDCFADDGESYRGNVSETQKGRECLYWNSQFILENGADPLQAYDDEDGLGPHNFCRLDVGTGFVILTFNIINTLVLSVMF